MSHAGACGCGCVLAVWEGYLLRAGSAGRALILAPESSGGTPQRGPSPLRSVASLLASCVHAGRGVLVCWMCVSVCGAVPLSLVSALCWWWLGVRFCGHYLGFFGGAVVRGCGHHEPPALDVSLSAWDLF